MLRWGCPVGRARRGAGGSAAAPRDCRCPAPLPHAQAIAYLAALCHEAPPPRRPHIVVVPLSTLPNWQREFARFAPHLNVLALAGR